MQNQGYPHGQAGQRPYPQGEDLKKNISPALLIPDNPHYLMYPQPGSPGLYPMPGQYPQAYGPMPGIPQQPEAPKKSGMPLVGMIMGVIAMVFGLLLMVEAVLMMNANGIATSMCCLGGLLFILLILVSSVLGIVFSGISMSKMKSKKIIPTPMAKVGLILSIIAILLMIFSIILIIYRILNPSGYSGGELILQTLAPLLF